MRKLIMYVDNEGSLFEAVNKLIERQDKTIDMIEIMIAGTTGVPDEVYNILKELKECE